MKYLSTFFASLTLTLIPFGVIDAQIIDTMGNLNAPIQGAAMQASSNDRVLKSTSDKGLGSDDPSNRFFQLVSCSGVDDPRTTDKKEVECDYNQLVATAYRIVKFVLYLLVPILLMMIVYTGWQFLTAGGDTMKLDSAKKKIKPLFLGIVLIFCAWLIVYTILDKFITDDPTSGIKKSDIVPTNK